MGRTEEIAKLDRAIKDTEIRIRTVSTNIDALNKEIEMLLSVEKHLDENVKCLKEKKIIAVATEYKKAKEDLKKTRTRMAVIKNDRDSFCKTKAEAESFLAKNKTDFDKLKSSADRNVYKGNFGRKK